MHPRAKVVANVRGKAHEHEKRTDPSQNVTQCQECQCEPRKCFETKNTTENDIHDTKRSSDNVHAFSNPPGCIEEGLFVVLVPCFASASWPTMLDDAP